MLHSTMVHQSAYAPRRPLANLGALSHKGA